MGENFLRKQAERFKHGQDRAFAEMNRENLLTRMPELRGHSVVCRRAAASVLPPPGAEVSIVIHGGSVFWGNEHVADVPSPELALLERLQGDLPAGMESVPGEVLELLPVTEECVVRVALEQHEAEVK